MKDNKVDLHIHSAQRYADSGEFQKAINHSRRALELQFGMNRSNPFYRSHSPFKTADTFLERANVGKLDTSKFKRIFEVQQPSHNVIGQLFEILNQCIRIETLVKDYRDLTNTIGMAGPDFWKAFAKPGETSTDIPKEIPKKTFLTRLTQPHKKDTHLGEFGGNVLDKMARAICKRHVTFLDAIEHMFVIDKALISKVNKVVLNGREPETRYLLEDVNFQKINNQDLCNLLIELIEYLQEKLIESCACTTSQMTINEFRLFIEMIQEYIQAHSAQMQGASFEFIRKIKPYLENVYTYLNNPAQDHTSPSGVFYLMAQLDAQVTSFLKGTYIGLVEQLCDSTIKQLQLCDRKDDIQRISETPQRFKEYKNQVNSLSDCKPSREKSKK